MGLSLTVLRDGEFLGRQLPPYGAITNARQLAWLDLKEREPEGADRYGRFDRELGWTNKRGMASSDGLYHFNALGARSLREYEPAPPEGVTRLLCFGDSFTFGEEVPDGDDYPALFEDTYPGYEALNFGVGGYGTDQALLRFRRLAPGLGGHVVCIGLLLENIGRNVNRYRPLWYPGTPANGVKPRFILGPAGLELVPLPFADGPELIAAVRDGSVLELLGEHEYWRGRPELPTGRWSGLGRLFAGYLAYSERQPRRLWLEPGGEPYRVSVALLERFHAEALELGAETAVVLLFPLRGDLEDYVASGERYWSGLCADLERLGIPYLDLVEPLAQRHREALADPRLGSVLYGGHLSGAGNAVVARELHRWISAAGVGPQGSDG